MKKTFLTVVVLLLAWSNVDLKAQETITNAFDDLKRTGTVNEQDSEMRQATSDTALQKLLTQKPAAGYFCFAEDRMHDIRLDQIIPARWTERVFDTWLQLKGDCQPGEFYTWQIGVFTPFKELKGVSVSFSDLVNADGNGNIPARYQDRYQNGADELVLVFCDTEKKPHEQYEDIKRKINEFHGVDSAANEVIMFGNPCTMQIISKHWTDENLKSPAKPVNAPLIKEYTGVENYKGRADQIQEVMEHVTEENYVDMCQRVWNLESDDSVTGSSNFGKYLKLLESDDSGWIEEINELIE